MFPHQQRGPQVLKQGQHVRYHWGTRSQENSVQDAGQTSLPRQPRSRQPPPLWCHAILCFYGVSAHASGPEQDRSLYDKRQGPGFFESFSELSSYFGLNTERNSGLTCPILGEVPLRPPTIPSDVTNASFSSSSLVEIDVSITAK